MENFKNKSLSYDDSKTIFVTGIFNKLLAFLCL